MSDIETTLSGKYRHIKTGTIYNRVTERNGIYTVTNEAGAQYFVKRDKLEPIPQRTDEYTTEPTNSDTLEETPDTVLDEKIDEIFEKLWTKETPFGQQLQGDDEAKAQIKALIESEVEKAVKYLVEEALNSEKSFELDDGQIVIEIETDLASLAPNQLNKEE